MMAKLIQKMVGTSCRPCSPFEYRDMSIKLKNRTSESTRSFERIQKCLVEHGAQRIMYEYTGTGLIKGITFDILMNGVTMPVIMPSRYENVAKILYKKEYERCTEAQKKQSYGTAWANIRDWIEVQMALYDTSMVKMAEVFFPYIAHKSGGTLFEYIEKNPQQLLN